MKKLLLITFGLFVAAPLFAMTPSTQSIGLASSAAKDATQDRLQKEKDDLKSSLQHCLESALERCKECHQEYIKAFNTPQSAEQQDCLKKAENAWKLAWQSHDEFLLAYQNALETEEPTIPTTATAHPTQPVFQQPIMPSQPDSVYLSVPLVGTIMPLFAYGYLPPISGPTVHHHHYYAPTYPVLPLPQYAQTPVSSILTTMQNDTAHSPYTAASAAAASSSSSSSLSSEGPVLRSLGVGGLAKGDSSPRSRKRALSDSTAREQTTKKRRKDHKEFSFPESNNILIKKAIDILNEKYTIEGRYENLISFCIDFGTRLTPIMVKEFHEYFTSLASNIKFKKYFKHEKISRLIAAFDKACYENAAQHNNWEIFSSCGNKDCRINQYLHKFSSFKSTDSGKRFSESEKIEALQNIKKNLHKCASLSSHYLLGKPFITTLQKKQLPYDPALNQARYTFLAEVAKMRTQKTFASHSLAHKQAKHTQTAQQTSSIAAATTATKTALPAPCASKDKMRSSMPPVTITSSSSSSSSTASSEQQSFAHDPLYSGAAAGLPHFSFEPDLLDPLIDIADLANVSSSSSSASTASSSSSFSSFSLGQESASEQNYDADSYLL